VLARLLVKKAATLGSGQVIGRLLFSPVPLQRQVEQGKTDLPYPKSQPH
jgi:hypothetical protein